MRCLDSVRAYFEREMLPGLREAVYSDDVLVVIGGSVSYGFSDGHSDVDVYLIAELPREALVGKLRPHLFGHQAIDGFRVQFIPLFMENGAYAPLRCVLREEFEKLKGCEPKLLFDIRHYLPVHDPKDLVSKGRAAIDRLGEQYWRDRCAQHCADHIDVLEAFYGSLKRGNVLTGSMYSGDALKGLLQIACLCAGGPYPTAKWLWSALERADRETFESLKQIFDGGLPRTCADMESMVRRATQVITDKLKEKGAAPDYIIHDMLSP